MWAALSVSRPTVRRPGGALAGHTSSGLVLQEFPHLKRQLWGRHFWAHGYFAATSGTITDDIINDDINEQEVEPVESDGRFQVDPS